MSLKQIYTLTGSSFLQSERFKYLIELGVLAEIGKLDVYTSSQSCAQVAWTCQNVTKVLVPLELVSLRFDGCLNLLEATTEALEDFLHVSCVLHRNHPKIYSTINIPPFDDSAYLGVFSYTCIFLKSIYVRTVHCATSSK